MQHDQVTIGVPFNVPISQWKVIQEVMSLGFQGCSVSLSPEHRRGFKIRIYLGKDWRDREGEAMERVRAVWNICPPTGVDGWDIRIGRVTFKP